MILISGYISFIYVQFNNRDSDGTCKHFRVNWGFVVLRNSGDHHSSCDRFGNVMVSNNKLDQTLESSFTNITFLFVWLLFRTLPSTNRFCASYLDDRCHTGVKQVQCTSKSTLHKLASDDRPLWICLQHACCLIMYLMNPFNHQDLE